MFDYVTLLHKKTMLEIHQIWSCLLIWYWASDFKNTEHPMLSMSLIVVASIAFVCLWISSIRVSRKIKRKQDYLL